MKETKNPKIKKTAIVNKQVAGNQMTTIKKLTIIINQQQVNKKTINRIIITVRQHLLTLSKIKMQTEADNKTSNKINNKKMLSLLLLTIKRRQLSTPKCKNNQKYPNQA